MSAILDENYRPIISPRIATRDRTKRLCWNLPDGSQVVIRHNRKTTWVWQWLSLGRKEMKLSDSFADEYSAYHSAVNFVDDYLNNLKSNAGENNE